MNLGLIRNIKHNWDLMANLKPYELFLENSQIFIGKKIDQ